MLTHPLLTLTSDVQHRKCCDMGCFEEFCSPAPSDGCLCNRCADANGTMLAGVTVQPGLEWTSGISSSSVSAVAVLTSLTCGSPGGANDTVPSSNSGCTWRNHTLYTHTITVGSDKKEGQRVDVVRQVATGLLFCCSCCQP